MGELKSGWRRVKFGEVVRLVSERCDPVSSGIERFVGLEHLEPGELRVRSWGEVADGTTFTNRFRSGQVLFGKRRAYQRKVALADFDGVCSGDIYVLESTNPERFLPELLPFICQSDAFFEHAVGTSAGSLSPRTNWTSLAEYEFALPPLDEQQRCVNALQAAARCNEAVWEAGRRLDELRKAVEVGMVMPPGARLNADHTFASVPQGWRLMSIREMCEARGDITIGPFGSNLLHSDYGGRREGVPVIFVRDIEPNKFTYRSDVFVSLGKAASLSSHLARPGDIVITTVGRPEHAGTPPGQAAVVPVSFPEAVIKADIIRVRVSPARALPAFVAYALNSPIGRQLTWRVAPGSTTRFKINAANLASIRLALPSVEEQARVVGRLQSLALAAEKLQARRQELASVARRFLSGN